MKLCNKRLQHSMMLFILLTATACAGPGARLARDYIVDHGVVNPQPENFKFCYGHGCNRSAQLHLDKMQWQKVRRVFTPATSDAAMERQRLTEAIAVLERIVGKMTGTDRDIGGTFPGTFRRGQLDCVDEAINTSTYLTMMEDDGLIHFHRFYQVMVVDRLTAAILVRSC